VRQCDPISPGNDAVHADWWFLGHVARGVDPSWLQQPCDGNLAQGVRYASELPRQRPPKKVPLLLALLPPRQYHVL
jgi:hypothetical protein